MCGLSIWAWSPCALSAQQKVDSPWESIRLWRSPRWHIRILNQSSQHEVFWFGKKRWHRHVLPWKCRQKCERAVPTHRAHLEPLALSSVTVTTFKKATTRVTTGHCDYQHQKLTNKSCMFGKLDLHVAFVGNT